MKGVLASSCKTTSKFDGASTFCGQELEVIQCTAPTRQISSIDMKRA
jgi:hypothetical protein